MSKPSIGVALITKNRLNELQRLLPQLVRFDQVVVVDTGSTDGSLNYVKKLGKPFELHKFPWRDNWKDADGKPYGVHQWGFAGARNETLRYIKTDYMLWLDTDDLIGGTVNGKEMIASPELAYMGFLNLVTSAPDRELWQMKYVYSHDEYGNPNTVHARERLVNMSVGWEWIYPIHELLAASRPIQKYSEVTDIQVIHSPLDVEEDGTARNHRYLDKWIEELSQYEEADVHRDWARARILLGQTLWAEGHFREASTWIHREYLGKHPELTDIEKWMAWTWIGRIQLAAGNYDAAKMAGAQAIELKPSLPDGYLIMAEAKLIKDEDPREITALIAMTGKCEDPPPEVMIDPLNYTYSPYCMLADTKFQLGEYQEAVQWAQRAVMIRPDDQRASALYTMALKEVSKIDAKNAATALYKLLRDFDENEKAAKLYPLLPYIIQEEPEIIKVASEAREKISHAFDDEEYIKVYRENSRTVPVPDELFLSEGPYHARTGWVHEHLGDAHHVLDVGCADGFMTLWLARQGREMVGLDIDVKSIAIANERAEKYEINATFFNGFFEKMDPDRTLCPQCGVPVRGHFDAAISCEVLEHVQNPDFFVGALTDWVKPGGPVLLSTPNGAYDAWVHDLSGVDRLQHLRAYTHDTFEALLKRNPEIDVIDAQILRNPTASHEEQGWLMGKYAVQGRPDGPVFRIFCGNVDFTPPDLKKIGLGGSETAVVHLARGLRERGCQVVVYNGAANGVYDGVFYRNEKHFDFEHRSDVFISWRFPSIFMGGRPNAGVTVLWNHDVGYGEYGISDEVAERIDKVACLSPWHRDDFGARYPALREKIFLTRNGIDPSRFEKKVEKHPHRFFYSSSWDRGLPELLSVWPQIREVIPDAELHVAYGYDLYLKFAKQRGNANAEAEVKELLQFMKEQPGITYRGKLDQDELADLQLSCGGWLYPPHEFCETYCITALEAQAAGCVPISRLNGALSTTLQNKVEWVELGDISKILKRNPLLSGKKLAENREWALAQTWDSLADEWLLELAPKQTAEV